MVNVPNQGPPTKGAGFLYVIALACVVGFFAYLAGPQGQQIGSVILTVAALAALPVGWLHGYQRRRWLGGKWRLIVPMIISVFALLTYTVAYLVGRWIATARASRPARPAKKRGPTVAEQIKASDDPLLTLQRSIVQTQGHLPGAMVGWSRDGNDAPVSASPRGGALVIGPPGSGKTSAVIIPSVLAAPGAVVSSSLKGDVMTATAAVRSQLGRCWHLDPGGGEVTPPGVVSASWSPLVGIHDWDDARLRARSMTEPSRGSRDNDGGHFTDRAEEWLAVLLYAAHIKREPIGTVATWAGSADTQPTIVEVGDALDSAPDSDDGAPIARSTLAGLIAVPDRERGSIVSTLGRLLGVYQSAAARRLGAQPNFDPEQFARSRDTLYITARPDRQQAYAPIIAGLLESIRFAIYDRAKRVLAGVEQDGPHVTFALDEAATTAPIPLPQIISEAGGQGLHLVVGLQALTLAAERWRTATESFLTLFPVKVVLPGLFEAPTVRALSEASGHYDRQMTGYSQSISYVSPGQGVAPQPITNWNPTYSMHREQVLTSADITGVPRGSALVWSGPDWTLLGVGMHWEPGTVWSVIIDQAERQLAQVRNDRTLATSAAAAQYLDSPRIPGQDDTRRGGDAR